MHRSLLTSVLWIASISLAEGTETGSTRGIDPSRTCGVIVGVLEWSDPLNASFSKADRQDRVLYQTLRRRGVPKGNLRLLLDEAATRKAVLAALRTQAEAAAEDWTFLFYYAGHGMQRSEGAYLSNFDIDTSRPESTGLAVSDIAETLAAHFAGERVLLLADCCHSGSLEQVVQQLAERGVAAACVTSVIPAGRSTENWTYTQTLIDVFRGRALADRDADGAVTFGEFHAEVADAMRHIEQQSCGFANRGWDDGWRLSDVDSTTQRSTDPLVGQYTLARDSANWVRGRIVHIRGNVVHVRLQRYSDRPILLVSRDQLQPVPVGAEADSSPPSGDPTALAPRTQVLVQLGDRMHPATVLECGPDRCLVSLSEFDDAAEWVRLNEVTRVEAAWEPYAVLVEWGGKWWPANIISQDGDRRRVHYVGWTDHWDEWVDASRVRQLTGDPGPESTRPPSED